jgi:hypothetical protein
LQTTKDFKTSINDKSDNVLSDIFFNSSKYKLEFIELVDKELINRKLPLESLKYVKDKKDEVKDESLALGRSGNQFWIVAAVLISLFGGIWALFAGYYYAYSKHKNTRGTEYFVYNSSTRKYGQFMVIIGRSILVLSIVSTFI